MPQHSQNRILLPLLGGMAALAVAMGVGRFAYTPLLPLMQQEFGFGADLGGGLASLNFVGYLAGALLCCFLPLAGRRTFLLRASLLVSIGTTALMGLTSDPALWGALRLVSGVASAGVMVLGSALVLEALADHPSAWLRGLIYSGIGLGIVLTGLLVLQLDSLLASEGIWLGLAAVALPLGALAWVWAPVDRSTPQGRAIDTPQPVRKKKSLLPWLALAYFCEGLGYIVTGTFLVAILRETALGPVGGSVTWMVVGLAAALFTPLWPMAARRYGHVPALVAAHLLQAAGIVLPALTSGLVAAIAGALLFGGTFLGIAIMSLNFGRTLAPERSTAVIGMLTAAFGVGQALGPLLGGLLAEGLGSFSLALAGAAAIVALGGLTLAGAAFGTKNAHQQVLVTRHP